MLATRPALSAAFMLGLLAAVASCGSGTLDPGTGSAGSGGSGGAAGGHACGPVCDIYCPFGNVLDENGCPTCTCKPGCLLILIACPEIACPYGYATDPNGCQTCQCNAAPVCDGVAPEACTTSVPPHCTCDPGLACAEIECGGPPPPVQPAPCPDGTVPPFNCVRNDDRQTCGWRVAQCPPTRLPIP